MQEEEFYLYLSSNNSVSVTECNNHRFGSVSNFIVRLPKEVNVQSYNIALSEVHFTKSWSNIKFTKGMNNNEDKTVQLKLTIDLTSKQNEGENRKDDSGISVQNEADDDMLRFEPAKLPSKLDIPVSISEKIHISPEHLVHEIQTRMQIAYGKEYYKIRNLGFGPVLENQVLVYYDKLIGRVKIKVSNPFSLTVSSELLQMLGFQKNQNVFSSGFKNSSTAQIFQADFPIYLDPFDEIFVEMDIVKPSIVGTRLAQVLRSIPVSGVAYGSKISVVFKQLQYHRLTQTRINTIHVCITDSFGNVISFCYGDFFLVLKFTKRLPLHF